MASLDPQAVLDATAHVAGGAVLGTHPGVYKGAGGIAGVKIAYGTLPETSVLAEQGPTHVAFWDGIPAIRGAAGDLTSYDLRIRMQLMVAVGPSDLPTAYRILTPFVKLYRDAFAAHVSLFGTCDSSVLSNSTGIIAAIYPNRIALEWFLIVTQKEPVVYAL